jgi:hypothetical protein
MIASSVERISSMVGDDAFVLDVGGWAKPFRRADVVLDQMPYATRGLYGSDGEGPERFEEASWIRRDICDRTPWPFADDTFDFAICSHTLEDVRDPVWVCAELARVARAGYIEVPSRLEEQSYGVQGPWVGWGHHHWLVDITAAQSTAAVPRATAPGSLPTRRGPGRASVQFVFKHHVMHGMAAAHFPTEFYRALPEDERVQSLWWEGGFSAVERSFVDAEGLDGYLASYVAAEMERRGFVHLSASSAGHVDGNGAGLGIAPRLRRVARAGLRRIGQPDAGRPAKAASTGIPEGVGS